MSNNICHVIYEIFVDFSFYRFIALILHITVFLRTLLLFRNNNLHISYPISLLLLCLIM